MPPSALDIQGSNDFSQTPRPSTSNCVVESVQGDSQFSAILNPKNASSHANDDKSLLKHSGFPAYVFFHFISITIRIIRANSAESSRFSPNRSLETSVG